MNTYDQIQSICYCVPSFPSGVEEADREIYFGSLDTKTPVRWASLPQSSEYGNYGRTYGFPQGANISPLMSILLLATKPLPTRALAGPLSTRKRWELLMYADDGMVYSQEPFKIEEVKS